MAEEVGDAGDAGKGKEDERMRGEPRELENDWSWAGEWLELGWSKAG